MIECSEDTYILDAAEEAGPFCRRPCKAVAGELLWHLAPCLATFEVHDSSRALQFSRSLQARPTPTVGPATAPPHPTTRA